MLIKKLIKNLRKTGIHETIFTHSTFGCSMTAVHSSWNSELRCSPVAKRSAILDRSQIIKRLGWASWPGVKRSHPAGILGHRPWRLCTGEETHTAHTRTLCHKITSDDWKIAGTISSSLPWEERASRHKGAAHPSGACRVWGVPFMLSVCRRVRTL